MLGVSAQPRPKADTERERKGGRVGLEDIIVRCGESGHFLRVGCYGSVTTLGTASRPLASWPLAIIARESRSVGTHDVRTSRTFGDSRARPSLAVPVDPPVIASDAVFDAHAAVKSPARNGSVNLVR